MKALRRLILALVLGEALTREEGRQFALELLRLRRQVSEARSPVGVPK